mgnify:CR=1 FL=1
MTGQELSLQPVELTLSLQNVEEILQLLVKQPYEKVESLITDIRRQVEPQVREYLNTNVEA